MARALRHLDRSRLLARLGGAGAQSPIGILTRAASTEAAHSLSTPPQHGSTEELIEMEDKFGAHNYHPLPVVFSRAQGAYVWDPEGRKYMDCLSAYSAVNQGHTHPRIIQALNEQSQRCTLTSRAFHNDQLPEFERMVTELFGYDRVLPMNTGAEAVETGLKIAKKWAYERKGVPADEALIVSCCGCFHGRTMAAVSMSCDNIATRGFGPLLPGQMKVDFGDLEGLRRVLQEHGPKIAAFLVEPIQGEAGVVVPPEGYLKAARDLCTQHNVLFIADEIQTGLGRTGYRLAVDHDNIRPDLVLLGKALGGGVLPVSVVLGDDDTMLTLKPGQHGSTFGGNPLASAVAMASLQVLEEEKLADNAKRLGIQLQEQLHAVWQRWPRQVKAVRGRGLLVAVEMDSRGLGGVSAMDICMAMKERGVLAKPTHDTIIRLAPPLTITDDDVAKVASVLDAVLDRDLKEMQAKVAKSPHAQHHPEPCDRCGRVVKQ